MQHSLAMPGGGMQVGAGVAGAAHQEAAGRVLGQHDLVVLHLRRAQQRAESPQQKANIGLSD